MPSTNKYHPFRYAASRPFSKKVASFWRSRAGLNMVPPVAALEGLQHILMTHYNEALEELPLDQRPSTMDIMFDELNRSVTYGAFCTHGRNIFDFDSELVAMFRRTDVADVPASSIRLPYNILYLSFGRQEAMDLGGGWFVDGAYVYVQLAEGKTYLHIDIATVSDDSASPARPTDFITNPDKRYHLLFNISQDKPIDMVLTEALDEEVTTIKASSSVDDHVADLADEAETYGMGVSSAAGEGSERRAKALQEGFSVFRQAVNLVVNALFFLTAYPDENVLDWPEGAPKRLTDKADHGKTAKEKQRAESKLVPIGFTRVRFCKLPHRYKDDTAAQAVGSGRQHWRRGHWRNQPYGEKRKLRKLIWILPVIVNRDADDETTGRIYTVE